LSFGDSQCSGPKRSIKNADMDLEVNSGSSIVVFETEASCGPQFASDMDSSLDGIGKCKNDSN
jgi:hypothetical protein